MLQCLVAVPDLLGLLKLLHQIPVFLPVRLVPQSGAFFKFLFFFHLCLTQVNVRLLELVGLLALLFRLAIDDLLLLLELLFLLDLSQDEVLLLARLFHLLLLALLKLG